MISFVLNGEDHTAENISPTMTMLDYVRGVAGLPGIAVGEQLAAVVDHKDIKQSGLNC